MWHGFARSPQAEAGRGPGASSSRAKRPGERSERLWTHVENPIRVALCRLSWYVSAETGWKGRRGYREDLRGSTGYQQSMVHRGYGLRDGPEEVDDPRRFRGRQPLRRVGAERGAPGA